MSIKNRLKARKTKINNWLYDHMWIRRFGGWAGIFIVSSISAVLFALGFNMFIDIQTVNSVGEFVSDKLVSGGVSGFSQSVVLFFEICGWHMKDPHLAISILYFAINAPLMIFAFFKVGRQFAVFTLINVAEVSLFIKLFSVASMPSLQHIIDIVTGSGGGLLARALFGGIFIGLSSALAYRVDISAGGFDVIAYWMSMHTGTSTGKYSFLINITNLTLFVLLSCALAGWGADDAAVIVGRGFYSIVYLFTSMLVVDSINLRNKKVKIEIISEVPTLGSTLLDVIPHGATFIQGKGVFSGQDKYIFTMVVSHYEVPKVIRLVQKADSHAFVQAAPLSHVYGNFFNRPVK